MRYWLLLLCLFSIAVHANAVPSCDEGPQCVTEQQLHLNVALGYGQRSNPLFGGDKLPLIVLPDVYYYGENWFFDNGKLGSSWALTEQWQLSLIGQFNQEKGYFHKWFGTNAFQLSQGMQSSLIASERIGPQQASVREVGKRPTAFDVGLQLNWFDANWQLQGNLWQDVSNTYQGQHASIRLGRAWQHAYGQFQLGASLHWKSAKLIDTYYGIDNNDPFYLPRYHGKPSWQPELRLNWQKPLSERVALLAFLRYLHLDDAMTDSPLVRSNNVTTWFFGISYRFF